MRTNCPLHSTQPHQHTGRSSPSIEMGSTPFGEKTRLFLSEDGARLRCMRTKANQMTHLIVIPRSQQHSNLPIFQSWKTFLQKLSGKGFFFFFKSGCVHCLFKKLSLSSSSLPPFLFLILMGLKVGLCQDFNIKRKKGRRASSPKPARGAFSRIFSHTRSAEAREAVWVSTKASGFKCARFLFCLLLHLDPGGGLNSHLRDSVISVFLSQCHLIKKMLNPQQGEYSHKFLLSFLLKSPRSCRTMSLSPSALFFHLQREKL